METDLTTGLRMELKYCAGCGGLLAREVGSGQIYCAGCHRQLVEMELPRFANTRPRAPVAKVPKLESLAELECCGRLQ